MTERDDLAAEVADLKARVADLEARFDGDDEAESGSESGASDRWGDPIDHPVLDSLTPGEAYTAKQLTSLYRQKTRATTKGTVRDRVENLTKSELFGHHPRHSTWEFLGEDEDDGE